MVINMNASVLLGMLSGITVGIIISVLLTILCNKGRKYKTEYDERQQQVRGKGFKYGFFVMLGMLIVFIVVKGAGITIPIHDAVLLFLIAAVGISEYVTYAIMHDAYFGLNNKIDSYLLLFAVIAVINIIGAVLAGLNGTLVEDGVLGLNGINMLCAAMFIWIFLVLVIKKISEEKED